MVKQYISVENPEFFYISDDETDFTIEIVSQNLVTTSNFVKFRDSQNFTFFEVSKVTSDTLAYVGWLIGSHVSTGEQVKHKSKWDPCGTCVTT